MSNNFDAPDFDPLTAPIGQVQDYLRAQGFDPDAIRHKGDAIGRVLRDAAGSAPQGAAPESSTLIGYRLTSTEGAIDGLLVEHIDNHAKTLRMIGWATSTEHAVELAAADAAPSAPTDVVEDRTKPPPGYTIVNRGDPDSPWWDIDVDPDGDPDSREATIAGAWAHYDRVRRGG